MENLIPSSHAQLLAGELLLRECWPPFQHWPLCRLLSPKVPVSGCSPQSCWFKRDNPKGKLLCLSNSFRSGRHLLHIHWSHRLKPVYFTRTWILENRTLGGHLGSYLTIDEQTLAKNLGYIILYYIILLKTGLSLTCIVWPFLPFVDESRHLCTKHFLNT